MKMQLCFIVSNILDGNCPTWQEGCTFIGPLNGVKRIDGDPPSAFIRPPSTGHMFCASLNRSPTPILVCDDEFNCKGVHEVPKRPKNVLWPRASSVLIGTTQTTKFGFKQCFGLSNLGCIGTHSLSAEYCKRLGPNPSLKNLTKTVFLGAR